MFAIKVALLNTLALGIFFWSIVMVFPDKLSMIFTSSTPVIKMVGGFAFLLATTILCNCVQPVLSGEKFQEEFSFYILFSALSHTQACLAL